MVSIRVKGDEREYRVITCMDTYRGATIDPDQCAVFVHPLDAPDLVQRIEDDLRAHAPARSARRPAEG